MTSDITMSSECSPGLCIKVYNGTMVAKALLMDRWFSPPVHDLTALLTIIVGVLVIHCPLFLLRLVWDRKLLEHVLSPKWAGPLSVWRRTADCFTAFWWVWAVLTGPGNRLFSLSWILSLRTCSVKLWVGLCQAVYPPVLYSVCHTGQTQRRVNESSWNYITLD